MGMSLNDTLIIGPTTHRPLFDVLIRFRSYRIALVYVSQMYHDVELVGSDRHFHRFVCQNGPEEPLADYRITHVTFGVSASSFVANMSVKQYAANLSHFAQEITALKIGHSLPESSCIIPFHPFLGSSGILIGTSQVNILPSSVERIPSQGSSFTRSTCACSMLAPRYFPRDSIVVFTSSAVAKLSTPSPMDVWSVDVIQRDHDPKR